MHRAIRVLLLLGLFSFTGCSYMTNFDVVNKSDQTIVVRYVVKKPTMPDVPPSPPIVPAIKPISELHSSTSWRNLSDSQYSFDPVTRQVTVSLSPNEVLRIAQHDLVDKKMEDEDFSIEAIQIKGARGELSFRGALVLKSFVAESKREHTLTYE